MEGGMQPTNLMLRTICLGNVLLTNGLVVSRGCEEKKAVPLLMCSVLRAVLFHTTGVVWPVLRTTSHLPPNVL